MSFKRNIALFCFGLSFVSSLSVTAPVTAQAQSRASQTESRLLRLENEIQTLSRAIYRGERPVQTRNYTTNTTDKAEYTSLSRRLTSMENELRRLIGQIEEQGHAIHQLQNQLTVKNNAQRAEAEPSIQLSHEDTRNTVNIRKSKPHQLGTLIQTNTGAQNATVSGVDMDASKLYDTAFAALQKGDYIQAEDHFSKFLANHNGSPLAANAQYWLSETQFIRNDYTSAARNFALGYQTYPSSPKAPDNLLKLGLSLSELDQKQEACVTFDELFQKYPSAARSLLDRAVEEKKSLSCG